MTDSRVAKQGYVDGLCGIYCLVNAIHDRDSTWSHYDAFCRLIPAVERLGMLDTYHLTVGFEAYELIEVFNFFASRNRFPLRAIHLDEAVKHYKTSSGIQTLKALVDAKGMGVVLVTEEAESHWVLINDHSGDHVAVLDSWHSSTRESLKRLSNRDEAFALVQYPSALAERV